MSDRLTDKSLKLTRIWWESGLKPFVYYVLPKHKEVIYFLSLNTLYKSFPGYIYILSII